MSSARLEMRISNDLHEKLKRVAEIEGRTMTDFVTTAIQDAMRCSIEKIEIIKLSFAEQERFAKALISPPPLPPALKRAFSRRSKMLTTK